jgi:predicted nucleotidyltransferase
LHTLFAKYRGIERVVLYGSRAKGNFREGSDIDLSLFTDSTFTRDDLTNLANDFDDSDMPYLVDCHTYHSLKNEKLKNHIDRVGKVLYARVAE